MTNNFLKTKIVIPLIVFLLNIFPWSPYLISTYQGFFYPGAFEMCDILAEAFINNDADTIYDWTSDLFKENNPDLKNRIQEMINMIDEDIVSYKNYRAGFKNDGYKASETFYIVFKTSTKEYRLESGYIVKDPYNPERVGLRWLVLENYYEKHSYKTLSGLYPELPDDNTIITVRDSFKNRDSNLMYNTASESFKEVEPDLNAKLNNIINMVEGNYKSHKYESFARENFCLGGEEPHFNRFLHETRTLIYETDVQVYRITIYTYLLSGNHYNGLNGIALEKINDDGTSEMLACVMDEKAWNHELSNVA